MGLIEVLLLSVGLAMDSFAVSICKGLAAQKITVKEYLLCGIWFGFFQGFMPFIGYLVGSRFERLISFIAPWLAFLLLSFIGGNMIREAFGEEDEDKGPGFDVKTMFMMAVATSIDALAVGITFVAIPVEVINASHFMNMVFAVCMIGIITFVISMIGVRIGSIFGIRYKAGSEAAGGTILIFIGLRTLIEHLDYANTLGDTDTIFGMLIPLVGTLLGASFVYAHKEKLSEYFRSILAGVSSGIMLSISVWGMIEPSLRGLSGRYENEIIPVLIAFGAGVAFQYLLDQTVPHTHVYAQITEGPESDLKAEIKVVLAEVIHHIPEGIALGSIYSAHFTSTEWVSASAALALAIAIAIQNYPEAIFVSSPLLEEGNEVGKAFFMGVLSGIPVPLVGAITVVIVTLFPGSLPFVMTAAGAAMIYTTIEEIPQLASGKDNDKGTMAFILGFALVMLMIFTK